VPVNNLLVRSRSACSASYRMLVSQRPGIIHSRPSLTGLAAFSAAFPWSRRLYSLPGL